VCVYMYVCVCVCVCVCVNIYKYLQIFYGKSWRPYYAHPMKMSIYSWHKTLWCGIYQSVLLRIKPAVWITCYRWASTGKIANTNGPFYRAHYIMLTEVWIQHENVEHLISCYDKSYGNDVTSANFDIWKKAEV